MCVYPLVNGSPLASINTNSNGGCNTWGYDVRLQSQMGPQNKDNQQPKAVLQ